MRQPLAAFRPAEAADASRTGRPVVEGVAARGRPSAGVQHHRLRARSKTCITGLKMWSRLQFEETDAKLDRPSFIVHHANGQALAYVYFEEEPGRRAAAHLLTRDGARRIAANIDKLPELLLLRGRCRIFATVLKQNRALFLTTHEPCKYQASV